MKKRAKTLGGAGELRRRAQHRLREQPAKRTRIETKVAMQRLLQELQIHQIELELQNEELKQAKAEVDAGLEKYTDLYDFAPVGYFSLDEQGLILEVNLTGAALLGMERSRVTSRGFQHFVAPRSRPAFHAFLQEIFSGNVKQVCEASLLNASRAAFWAELRALSAITLSGARKWCRVAVTDNTARKQAEEALLKAGALQSAIFNSANFSSIATDAKGVIQIFNVGAERMLGYTAAEVMNKITPADISDPQEVIARAKALSLELSTPIKPGFEALVFKASRGIEDIYELTYIRKDGSRFPAVVSITALRDAQTTIIGYLLIGTDNTARRKAEEAVRQLYAELEQRVIQRTAELEESNKELEAFSYSVSHDLRAPLRALDGFSQTMLDDFGPQLPDEGQRYLKTIRYSAQQMSTLIDALLEFSRFNRQELNKRTMDTGKLVRSALDELGFPWQERQVEIRIGDLPVSSGDPVLLKQVWINLLSNALKYTNKRKKAEIEIGSTKINGTETFFVRDNGTGFDMRYADKLFGVFERLHRMEDYEGTGIGLAMVQRIVNRHEGRVWANAAIDQGATFSFTLEKAGKS
ncbi:MAG: PAS domain S-box protein [Opitutaceae bacterium]|nr:PAS domain S-box protein [Opitutaceae bacterium]